MFFLKQYDTTLLKFEINDDSLEGQKCQVIEVNDASRDLLPTGLTPTNEGLMKWLRGRVIPRNREFVNAFLAKCGLSQGDTRGILQVCLGLSLNDSYWVVEEGIRHPRYNLPAGRLKAIETQLQKRVQELLIIKENF